MPSHTVPSPIREIIIASTALGVAFFGYCWQQRRSASSDSAKPAHVSQKANANPDEGIHTAILAYLAQPKFTGEELAQQALGGAHLELYRIDNGVVFLSLPHRTDAEIDQFIGERFFDATSVRRAQEDRGVLTLGSYAMRKSEERWVLLATKGSNIKLDLEARFTFSYPSADYTIGARELAAFLDNRNIRGGRISAETGNTWGGRPEVFVNHGAFITAGEEPSLKRLVQQLLRGTANVPSQREARIQKLLDFVSGDIAYDSTVLEYDQELLQRANETLMSRLGDCSNKSILFASLLEQIGEHYLLAYLPGHICVALPQGAFPNKNGLTIQWNGSPYMLAETTAPGFRIGLDKLRNQEQFPHLEFLQNCSQPDTIVSIKTGRRVVFH